MKIKNRFILNGISNNMLHSMYQKYNVIDNQIVTWF